MARRRGRSARKSRLAGPSPEPTLTEAPQGRGARRGKAGVSKEGSALAYPGAVKRRESMLGIERSFHKPEAVSNFLPALKPLGRESSGEGAAPLSVNSEPSAVKLPYLKQNIEAVKLQSQGGPDRVGVLMKQGVVLPVQRLGDLDKKARRREAKPPPRHLSGMGLHAHMSRKQLVKGLDVYYSTKDLHKLTDEKESLKRMQVVAPKLMRDVNYYMGFYRDMASEYRDFRASMVSTGNQQPFMGEDREWQTATPDINYLTSLDNESSSDDDNGVVKQRQAKNATCAMDWASRPKAFTEDMRQPVRPQTGESGDERGGIVETRQSRGSSTAKPQAIMPLSKPAGSKEGDGRGELGPRLHRVLSTPRVKVQRRGGATLWLMDEEAAAVGVPIAMRAFMLRQFKGVSQLLVKEVLGFQRQFRRSHSASPKRVVKSRTGEGRKQAVLGERLFGFEANGLEDLLLLEALQSAPQGASMVLEERILDMIDMDSIDHNLVNGSLCAMLSSTKAVIQICRQVSFVQVDSSVSKSGYTLDTSAYCLAINLINSRLVPHDITSILYVLEMDGKQIANAVGAYNSQQPRGIERMKTTDVLEQLAPTPKHHSNAAVPLNAREQVQSTTGLTLLPLHHKSAVAAMHFSQAATAISHLLLSSTCVTDASVAALALCLRDMPWVKVLDLSDNHTLTWKCCAPLAELLQPPDPVAEEVGYSKHVIRGCGASRLQQLHLSGVAVGDKGLELLVGALQLNQHLCLLTLQSTGITANGAANVALLLEENSQLLDLRLGWNSLQASGAEVVAEALRSNHSLVHLDVANNGLTDTGGSHFAFALQGNAKLKSLDLSNNGIGSSSCLVLSESLKHNSSIETLVLNGNPLGAEGGMYLLNTLADDGTSLSHLSLQGASFMQRVDAEGRQQMMYNRANPNGTYALNLANPAERQIAMELTRLREQQGPDCWVDATMNGRPFAGPTLEDGWLTGSGPPKEGKLRLTFVASMAPPENAKEMRERDFANIVAEMTHPSADDLWRLSMLHVLCGTTYFTAAQARTLAETLQWRGELFQACLLLYMRVTDAHNLEQLTGCLRPEEERRLVTVLGMAAFFRPEHPSGHYALNLSRQTDRVVAMRLLMQARKEAPYWQAKPALRNFRNVQCNGQPLALDNPIDYDIPHQGFFITDFISYEFGTVLETVMRRPAHRRRFIPCAPVDFARFSTAVKSLQSWVDDQARASAARHSNNKTDTGSSPFESPPETSRPQLQEVEMTPRTAGAMMKRAMGQVVKQVRMRNPIRFAAQDGSTLVSILKNAEQWRASFDVRPKQEHPMLDQREFKRVITRVDTQAKRLMDQKRGKVSRAMLARMNKAAERIGGLNMAWKGMADIFDDSMNAVDPVAIVRMFASKQYCTCSQVLQLLAQFDSSNELHSALRVDIVQLLFTRTVDLAHFSDVLRVQSPLEQVQTMRRNGFLNCVYLKARNHLHLHSVYFALRMSVGEEFKVCKSLAEYIPTLPNPASTGNSAPDSIFANLHINGAPASISEDAAFWKTLQTVAKDRRRPDDSWDPMGTVEFQLLFPIGVRREMAARHIQRVWRGSRWRKRHPKKIATSQHLRRALMGGSSEMGKKVGAMLAALTRGSPGSSVPSTPDA